MANTLDTRFPERRTINVVLTILLFAAVCAVGYCARRVILLFVLSIFFAYLLHPAVNFLERHSLHFRLCRGAAVLELYMVILILAVLLAYRFAPAMVRKTMQAVDAVPVLLDGVSSGEIADQIGARYGWNDEQKARVKTVLLRHRQNFKGLQNWIDSSLSQAAQVAAWMALIPILAIFLLRDGRSILESAFELFLPPGRREPARAVARELHLMLTNYIRAQVLLCLFSLGFYLAVLLVFRFPHAIALAFLGAALEFVPVFGWITTAMLIVGVGMANDLHWAWMGGLLLLRRVAQDYFNLPRAFGHRLEIHPLTVIFAILAGAEVGGIVGIYLSVPVAASLLVIWRLHSARLKTPERQSASEVLPISTEMARD